MTSSTGAPFGHGSGPNTAPGRPRAWPRCCEVTRCRKARAPGALDLELAHVRDVEQPRRPAHGQVLRDEARVLDGHVPAAEGDHLGPALAVDGVQGRLAQRGGGSGFQGQGRGAGPRRRPRPARYHEARGEGQRTLESLGCTSTYAINCPPKAGRRRKGISSPAGTASGTSTPSARSGARTTRRTRPSSARSASAASATRARGTSRSSGAAPPRVLHDELQTLAASKDRMGDILIRMKKLQTPELLEALVEQRASGRRLGEILVSRGPGAPGRHRRRPQDPGREPPRGHPGPRLCGEPRVGAERALGHHRLPREPRGPEGGLRHPPRSPGQRRVGALPDRRLLVPGRPDPGALQAGPHRHPLRHLRPRSGGGLAAAAGAAGGTRGRDRLRPRGPDPAHHPRHERHHQARQPRDLPQGFRHASASSSRTACVSWRSCARGSAWPS